jgi:hypothetical protein
LSLAALGFELRPFEFRAFEIEFSFSSYQLMASKLPPSSLLCILPIILKQVLESFYPYHVCTLSLKHKDVYETKS